ncbi:F-box protein [Caballeronia sp. EK]|uniref:F-box protein n=1 Tax=Caballeronia sp. EK TaxID=2767469 RepID=UPI001655DC48|nr:F-box protein [Caballeronia sp. EK]MBC8643033.1 F-box protein [Caballeronia sp. EK]
MSDIMGATTHHRSPRFEQSSFQEHIVETLQSVNFSDPASVQQARDRISSELEGALRDHLFEHGTKQSALQQVAALALAREAQRQGYGDVLGLTSQDLRMAQILLISLLSQVGVDTFMHGELRHDPGPEALEFRFDSGRESLDTLMTLSFPVPNLGYELNDLPRGGEQLLSSLVVTALDEARDLDPKGLNCEIQAAVTRLNSHASASVQSELPPEVLRKIHSYMPRRDLDAMRCVNTEFSILDAREVAKFKVLMERAANANSRKDFQAVLDDIQKLLPGYRQKPLATFVDFIPKLAEDQRLTRFYRVLAAAKQLNAVDTARLLTALVGRISWLPSDYAREQAFTHTLDTVEQISIEHQSEPLAALVKNCYHASDEVQFFDRMRTHIKQHNVPERGIVLARLFAKISYHPEEKMFTSYQQIFDAVEQLDKPDQGKALIEIARKVQRVRGSFRFRDLKRDTFDRFLGMVEQLSFTDRQKIGKVLAYQFEGRVYSSELPRVLRDVESRLGVSLTEKEKQPSKACSLQ